ncbi:hypothetical protein D3C76_1788610 [compost metagenome]
MLAHANHAGHDLTQAHCHGTERTSDFEFFLNALDAHLAEPVGGLTDLLRLENFPVEPRLLLRCQGGTPGFEID